MSDLHVVSPAEAGLNPTRWAAAIDQLGQWCAEDALPSAGLIAGQAGRVVEPVLLGRQRLDDSEPIASNACFLIASITKPIVGMAALMLAERGLLMLSDKVTEYIPDAGRNGKNGMRIRNLLTHTSGLPDMLDNNVALREAKSPLSAFVEGTCDCELKFPVGRGVSYQSMGFALLGEIIHRVSGQTCAEFVRQEIFEPLGMTDSWLGLPDAWFDDPSLGINRLAEIRTPPQQQGREWNWNERYWRQLGAPWGGMITTPTDLARFCQMMLGHSSNTSIVSPAMVQAATRNQLEVMPDVPEVDRRTKPWGLGWRLNWPAHSANFGDFLGPRTYGHWGATGTVLWIDPDRETFFVLLTTQPQEPHGTLLARMSNSVASAFV